MNFFYLLICCFSWSVINSVDQEDPHEDNKFIHASTKKGVIVGDLTDPYNVKYFMRGGRL